jgi:hypothetical protein
MSFADLFKPRWRHSDVEVRRRAVKTLTDPATLARVAKDETDDQAARLAAERISDADLLVDIARHATNEQARAQAVIGITDQSVLAEIAREDRQESVRSAAVERLTDQSALAGIAREDAHWSVRHAALERLTDQSRIGEVALMASDVHVRTSAVGKLNGQDQAILNEVLAHAEYPQLRFNAAVKLTDAVTAQGVLRQLVATLKGRIPDSGLCAFAVSKLQDQRDLAAIAGDTAHEEGVRLKAIEGIHDQSVLVEIVMTDREKSDYRSQKVLMTAVEKLTDQALLARLARTAPGGPEKQGNSALRGCAVKKLRDVALLAEIVEQPSASNLYWAELLTADGEIRDAATRKLALLTKTRSAQITDRPKWECPDCGAIGDKDELAGKLMAGSPTSTLSGPISCRQCGGGYQEADVYGGCYDVVAEQINVLVFCLQAYTSPRDKEGYCRRSLGGKHTDAEMTLTTLVGWKDRSISDYEAISAYRSYVGNRQIVSHGRLFDRFRSKGPDGRDVYVLVFVP